MPTPEEILPEALAQQERDRLKALAKREKLDRRRQPYSAYYGTDGATGQARVKPLGSEGVLEVRSLSNSQPSMGQYGRGFGVGFDAGNVHKPEIEIFAKPKGDVAVLARLRVADGTWQVWLGGDRKNPLLIADRLPSRPFATLELLGSGKDDWMVSLKYGQGSQSTIGMRYGTQNSALNREDWTITGSLVSRLGYMGGGFWCTSEPIAYSIDHYETTEFNQSIGVTAPVPGTATLVQIDCHDQVDGQNSTIAVPYCETIYLDGDRTASHLGFDRKRGFDPNYQIIEGHPFAGTNEFISEDLTTAEWEGEAQGSNFLGEPNIGCLLSDSPLTGTSLLPRFKQRSDASSRLVLNTQSFSFSAYNGEITTEIGQHRMNQASTSSGHYANGGLKRADYIGQCTEFTTGYFWTIGETYSEAWDAIPLTQESNATDFTASYSNNHRISPLISKPFQFSALGPEIIQVESSSEYTYPFSSNSGGLFWTYGKRLLNGPSYIGNDAGTFPRYLPGSTNSFKQYLVYNGNEHELDADMQYDQTTWKQTAESEYPVGFKAEYNYDIDTDDNLLINDVKFDIFRYKATLIGGKLVYENEKISEKKAFAIKALGDTTEILDIKYWPRL
jgi:hypothetical protein